MTWWVRAQAWWHALWHTGQLDAAMHDEMRFHIDMEAERLMRERGLPSDEARRQAHIAFGGLEKFKEAGRDTRGRRWLDAVSLDTRLGVRMLVKHRGLTIVGGFAMAVAIGIGATFFELVSEVLNPVLPLEDGERVVALQFETANPGSPERRVIHDFVALRDELTSVAATCRVSHHRTQPRVGRGAAGAGQGRRDHRRGLCGDPHPATDWALPAARRRARRCCPCAV